MGNIDAWFCAMPDWPIYKLSFAQISASNAASLAACSVG
jgi:hypothetical protein